MRGSGRGPTAGQLAVDVRQVTALGRGDVLGLGRRATVGLGADLAHSGQQIREVIGDRDGSGTKIGVRYALQHLVVPVQASLEAIMSAPPHAATQFLVVAASSHVIAQETHTVPLSYMNRRVLDAAVHGIASAAPTLRVVVLPVLIIPPELAFRHGPTGLPTGPVVVEVLLVLVCAQHSVAEPKCGTGP